MNSYVIHTIKHIHSTEVYVRHMCKQSTNTPQFLLLYVFNVLQVTVLREAKTVPVDDGYLSVPKHIQWPTANGETAYGYFYQPVVSACSDPSSIKVFVAETKSCIVRPKCPFVSLWFRIRIFVHPKTRFRHCSYVAMAALRRRRALRSTWKSSTSQAVAWLCWTLIIGAALVTASSTATAWETSTQKYTLLSNSSSIF